MDIMSLLNALLNNPYEKIIITDTDGTILFMNEAYCQAVGVEKSEEIIKLCPRLHVAGKTLKAELCDLFLVNKSVEGVARRYPLITEDGRVLGVLGKDLFSNVDDMLSMSKKVRSSK